MTYILDLPDWNLHIRTEKKLFVIVSTIRNEDDTYIVYLAIAFGDSEEDAITKMPQEDRDSFDHTQAFDLLSVINQAHTLNEVYRLVDDKLNRK